MAQKPDHIICITGISTTPGKKNPFQKWKGSALKGQLYILHDDCITSLIS